MTKEIVATQVRLPESLYNTIKCEATEMCVPVNSHIIELLYLGMKVREGTVFILPKEE